MLESPEIHQAFGAFHREVFGVHFITTFSWIRDGDEPQAAPFVPIYSIRREDWSVTFIASQSFAAQASEWFGEHGMEMRSRFDTMLDIIRPAFPASGARRFVVYVLPPRSRIDLGWPQVVTSDNDLRLVFAVRLPGPGQDNNESISNVSLLLAHEFSHSYFWFHPEHYSNNFSDEVIAYSIQRCVSVRIFGGAYGDLTAGYSELETEAAHLPLGQIYQRFHDKYPDSYLANLVSAFAFRRAELGRSGNSQEVSEDYCRTIATAGRDFTRSNE